MLYHVIGKTYAQTRKSDPRIAAKLLGILASSQASTVADIVLALALIHLFSLSKAIGSSPLSHQLQFVSF